LADEECRLKLLTPCLTTHYVFDHCVEEFPSCRAGRTPGAEAEGSKGASCGLTDGRVFLDLGSFVILDHLCSLCHGDVCGETGRVADCHIQGYGARGGEGREPQVCWSVLSAHRNLGIAHDSIGDEGVEKALLDGLVTEPCAVAVTGDRVVPKDV